MDKGTGGILPPSLNGGGFKTYLTIKELSLYLKISLPTIYKWVKGGKIPYIRINQRVIRFDREKIDAYMGQHQVA